MAEKIKIGLDFGTTYSVLSRLKRGNDGQVTAEACALREGGGRTEIQDSIVLKNKNGQLLFGAAARGKIGRSRTVTYTGFKMMLAETDQEILKQRNYDETYTPEKVVVEYISDLLNQFTTNSRQDRIDKLVVGVPEIWFASTRTIDSRTILKNIIQSTGYVNEVEIVSEPAAACAYFVQNYSEKKKKQYEGKILVIDYGGGTLDIALCEVTGNGTSNDVKVIARAGAGWNTQGRVGKAGMAFMEEIVRIALKSGGLEKTDFASDQKFFECVQYIEMQIMSRTDDIRKSFRMNSLEPMEHITDEFDTIEYMDEEYEVTYGMLAQAYNRIIRGPLVKVSVSPFSCRRRRIA